MARRFNGTSDLITATDWGGFGTFVKQNPYSVSVWIRTNSLGSRRVAVGDWNSSGNLESFVIEQGSSVAPTNNTITVHTTSGTGTSTAIVMGSSTWYHVAVIWDGARAKIYVNSVKTNDDARASIPAGVTAVIGRAGAFNGLFWSGDIAHLAIWSLPLADGDVDALYRYVVPTLVRPERLLRYIPLRGVNREVTYGYSRAEVLTITGTTPVADPLGDLIVPSGKRPLLVPPTSPIKSVATVLWPSSVKKVESVAQASVKKLAGITA